MNKMQGNLKKSLRQESIHGRIQILALNQNDSVYVLNPKPGALPEFRS